MIKEDKLTRENVDTSFDYTKYRFENLKGRKFGELEILGVYKKIKNKVYWVAACSCGNVVKTSRDKLVTRGKTSCVECAEKSLSNKISSSLTVKVNTLLDKREDIEILNPSGDKWVSIWKVKCLVCGDIYKRSYRSLMAEVKPCKCTYNKRRGLDNKEGIVQDFCKKYDYTFQGWEEGSPIKLKISCNLHNEAFSVFYNNLLKNKRPCKSCVSASKFIYNKVHLKDFIKRSQVTHGVGNYNYSKVKYNSLNDKVKIKCNSCGNTNLQTAQNHLSGRGCNYCKKSGFKPKEPCLLYVLKLTGLCNEYYKVGITKDIKQRLYNLSLHNWFDIEVVSLNKLKFGWQAFNIEQEVLSSVESGVVSKRYQPEGYTETFNKEDLREVLEIIDEGLIKYYK